MEHPELGPYQPIKIDERYLQQLPTKKPLEYPGTQYAYCKPIGCILCGVILLGLNDWLALAVGVFCFVYGGIYCFCGDNKATVLFDRRKNKFLR